MGLILAGLLLSLAPTFVFAQIDGATASGTSSNATNALTSTDSMKHGDRGTSHANGAGSGSPSSASPHTGTPDVIAPTKEPAAPCLGLPGRSPVIFGAVCALKHSPFLSLSLFSLI